MQTTTPSRAGAATVTEPEVIAKALFRASAYLGLSNRSLSRILGLSEASVSRMSSGAYLLTAPDKAFDLAVMFLRLFRSLDAIVGGDKAAARAWLQSEHAVLGGRPALLIESVPGLAHVVAYLDARRAVV